MWLQTEAWTSTWKQWALLSVLCVRSVCLSYSESVPEKTGIFLFVLDLYLKIVVQLCYPFTNCCQSDRELCMKLLLQVKGVISITFDMNKRRSILRVKNDVKPEVSHLQ